MTILAQIGVIVLIVIIVLILFRSNKLLAKADEEGEQFVDAWALRQEKLLEQKERIAEKKAERESKKAQLAMAKEAERDQPLMIEEEPLHFSQEDVAYPEEKDLSKSDYSNIIPIRTANPKKRCTLIQFDHLGHVFEREEVVSFPFTIGRAPENKVVLDDIAVARKHAKIVWEDDEFVLCDMGSSSKIFVDGQQVVRLPLKDGQHFWIGNIEFLAEISAMGADSGRLYHCD